MVLNIRWLWVGEVHCLYLFADTIAVLFFGMRALSGNFGVRAFELHSQWAYCQVRAFICILAKNLKEPAVSAAGSFDYFFASLALALARCLFISAMSASQTSSMSPTMP